MLTCTVHGKECDIITHQSLFKNFDLLYQAFDLLYPNVYYHIEAEWRCVGGVWWVKTRPHALSDLNSNFMNVSITYV